jgi:hypothetical protein
VITGDYVYVFLEPNIICCFANGTGKYTAIAAVDIEDGHLRIETDVTLHKEYLYFGLWGYFAGQYFVRLNIHDIRHGDTEAVQTLAPELLWEPETEGAVRSTPVVYNNTVYTSTIHRYQPVEIAGFDIDTKQMVFRRAFGGPGDGDVPFPETGGMDDPILIHDGILYYLSWSIAAWDLKTGKQLYRHVFTWDIPERLNYSPSDLMIQPVYYRDKIYYVSRASYTPDSHRNIHCIDAKTGGWYGRLYRKRAVFLMPTPLLPMTGCI